MSKTIGKAYEGSMADMRKDKKAGIKEGSKRDMAMDKKGMKKGKK